MARITISDLSYELTLKEIFNSDSSKNIICGGSKSDFYYLLNYMAAGLAIYSIRTIADWAN